MDTATTLNEFVSLVGQDTGKYFRLTRWAKWAGDARTLAHRELKAILGAILGAFVLIVLFIPLVVLAQIVPTVFKKHLALVYPLLPYIEDNESLAYLRDAFLLYYHVLKGYHPFSFRRKAIRALMDELDEHIDSLSFVLENEDFLEHALEGIKHAQ